MRSIVYFPAIVKMRISDRIIPGAELRPSEQEKRALAPKRPAEGWEPQLGYIVAIDGPAGVGKSTVARRVAAALNFTYLDTGAMYRAVAWKAVRDGRDTGDAETVREIADQMVMTFSPLAPDGTQRVCIDDEDVTQAIRLPEISRMTSIISAYPPVRRIVVEQQRRIASKAGLGVVLEGRDIGTVVFPAAEVKVFLTASPAVRARRRQSDLAASGTHTDLGVVLAEQQERDARDSGRADSPLRPADDAVEVNTDDLTIAEVVLRILELCHTRLNLGSL